MVISPLMLAVVLVAYVIIQVQKHPEYPAWNPNYVSGFISHFCISFGFCRKWLLYMSAVLACLWR